MKSPTNAARDSSTRKLGYASEQELRSQLALQLSEGDMRFGELLIAFEFAHRAGRTDVIAQSSDGDLIAFETKLENWRSAMQQAYRNSSFAHYSYVVLPGRSAKKVAAEEFVKRRIGLCSMEDGQLTIEVEAPRQSPLQPWITEVALLLLTQVTQDGAASA